MGLLIKLVVLVGIMAAGWWYLSSGQAGFTWPRSKAEIYTALSSRIAGLNTSLVRKNLSAALDSLVTHPGTGSPVVLGLKISEDSLSALVDVISRLPSSDRTRLQQWLCTPASASAIR